MSAAERSPSTNPAASDVASRLDQSGFVHVIAAQTGDSVAAAGLLARALDTVSTPYQLSVVPIPKQPATETDAELTVALGRSTETADVALGRSGPASAATFAVATELGTANAELALAGAIAAGEISEPLRQALAESSLSRRPGIGIPVADPVDGLAHSTLIHTDISGSTEQAQEFVSGIAPDRGEDVADPQLSDETHKRIASQVALTVTGDEETPERAARNLERFLRPYVGEEFTSVGGYADVLRATAQTRPAEALSLALGPGDSDAAISHWRQYGTAVHEAIRDGDTARHSGLYVITCQDSTVLDTVARLGHQYRSPEELTLAVGDASAVAIGSAESDDSVGALVARAASAVDGDGDGTERRGKARFDCSNDAFVDKMQEER
jgi:hypothetical protein